MRIKRYLFIFNIALIILALYLYNSKVILCEESTYYMIYLKDEIRGMLSAVVKDNEEFKHIYGTNIFYFTHIKQPWFIEKFVDSIPWEQYIQLSPEQLKTFIADAFINYVRMEKQQYLLKIRNNILEIFLQVIAQNPDFIYVLEAPYNLLTWSNNPVYYQEHVQYATFYTDQLILYGNNNNPISKQEYLNVIKGITNKTTQEIASRVFMNIKFEFNLNGQVDITIACIPIGKFNTLFSYIYN